MDGNAESNAGYDHTNDNANHSIDWYNQQNQYYAQQQQLQQQYGASTSTSSSTSTGQPLISQSASVTAVRSMMSLSPTPTSNPNTGQLHQPYIMPLSHSHAIPHIAQPISSSSTLYGNSNSSSSSSNIGLNGSGIGGAFYQQQSNGHYATQSQLSPRDGLLNNNNGASIPISTFNYAAANSKTIMNAAAGAGTISPPLSKGAAATAQKREYWLGWLQTEERCASVAAREMDHFARILVRN
jgi:hypothetical protein